MSGFPTVGKLGFQWAKAELKRRLNKGGSISLKTSKIILEFLRELSYSIVFNSEEMHLKMSYSKETAKKRPIITPLYEALRVLWTKKHEFINWNKVFFADVCSIWLCGGKIQMYSKALHQHSETFTQ